MPPKRRPLAERIAGKYVPGPPDECWPWLGARTSANYGHVLADGGAHGHRRTVLAHRAVYELTHGPIPDNSVLDHTCHTKDEACPGNAACEHRACVNPSHLEPVSFGENCMRGRGIAPRNAAKTPCNRGHEFTSENTRFERGARVCLECKRHRFQEWKQRKAERERNG